MIKQLAHICIGAKDLAAAERFYCGLLGLEKKFAFTGKDGGAAGLYLKAGDGVFIEIFPETKDFPDGPPRIRHLCLEVEDLDHVIATLLQNGWEVTEKKLGCDQSWQAWTHDPSGIPIEFHEYTFRSHQFTGEDCLVDW